MSLTDPSKQKRVEEFLRKSLLGEDLINTEFHLFSARSVLSSRLTRPRVLCANNVLLAESSRYFSDLLSSDLKPSDPALSDLTDANDIPSNVQINEYGYESDSDLDDDDDDDDREPSIPITNTEPLKGQSATVVPSPLQIGITVQPKDDDELSEGGSESVSSDMFVMSPEHPTMDEPFTIDLGKVGSVTSSQTVIQGGRGNKVTTNHASVPARVPGSRHVLVTDTAFQTWYNLLNYLYTGMIDFMPLSSAVHGRQPRQPVVSPADESRCSAKSMYRLACKLGLDDLRDEAFAHIQSNLTEQNILKELTCSLVSKYSQLLEMELDVLYTHIASPSVVTGFPALAQRIAHKELPHGADIIVGIHSRLLQRPYPSPSTSMSPLPSPVSCPPLFSCSPPQPRFSLRGSPMQVVGHLSDTIKIGPPDALKCHDECGLLAQPTENVVPVSDDGVPVDGIGSKCSSMAAIAAKSKKKKKRM